MIGKLLSWKLVGGLLLVAAVYAGSLHLRLSWARSDAREAQAAEQVARDANATNLRTIGTLKNANRIMADAVRLSGEARERMNAQAKRAEQEAARARGELKRLRELDRESPDCAALLDRTLAVCPDLVRRLWPTDSPD